MEFNRRKLNARLHRFKNHPKQTREKFVAFATKQGILIAKYRHLRKFIAIVKLLNNHHIDSRAMMAGAKWLRANGYGRFNAVKPEANLPVLTDAISTAVKFNCTYPAKPYLQFIAGKMELPFVEHMLQLTSGE